MTLAELIERCDGSAVREALLAHYPDAVDALEALEQVLGHLRQLSPEADSMRIHIEEVFRPGIDDEPFTDVSGRDAGLNEDGDSAQAQTAFALEFTPWTRWLGMAIDPSTLQRYTHPQIAAHCLWEMTYLGFEEADIEKAVQALGRSAKEVGEGDTGGKNH